MQVFRLYFKLLKKSLPSILIYFGIFAAIIGTYATLGRETNEKIFQKSKTNVAFINRDEDSVFVEGFKKYLTKTCVFKEVDDTKESLQDALFFHQVSYILIIPEGFTQSFLAGEQANVEKQVVPDSAESMYVDMAVNNYLNTARTYVKNAGTLSQAELGTLVAKDFESEVTVNMYSKEKKQADYSFDVVFYNYLVYAMLSAFILSISIVMISFSNVDIRRRNIVTPMTHTSFQVQQLLGHFSLAMIFDVLIILFGFILKGDFTITRVNLLFILNAFLFSIVALSIAFLIGILVKSREATNGIANVLCLGCSFISGVFVPKELLGESVLRIAKFTPSYWYVTANETIGSLTNFTSENLGKVYQYMLIQVGFAAAIFAVSLVVSKRKRQEVV